MGLCKTFSENWDGKAPSVGNRPREFQQMAQFSVKVLGIVREIESQLYSVRHWPSEKNLVCECVCWKKYNVTQGALVSKLSTEETWSCHDLVASLK